MWPQPGWVGENNVPTPSSGGSGRGCQASLLATHPISILKTLRREGLTRRAHHGGEGNQVPEFPREDVSHGRTKLQKFEPIPGADPSKMVGQILREYPIE